MFCLSNQSATSTSFGAMFLLSVAGLFVLGALGPQPVDAFSLQNRCDSSRHRCKLKATRRNAILVNENTQSSTKHNIDIAKVWASSLEETVDWHASSRRYLSDGLPTLEDSSRGTSEHHSNSSTP